MLVGSSMGQPGGCAKVTTTRPRAYSQLAQDAPRSTVSGHTRARPAPTNANPTARYAASPPAQEPNPPHLPICAIQRRRRSRSGGRTARPPFLGIAPPGRASAIETQSGGRAQPAPPRSGVAQRVSGQAEPPVLATDHFPKVGNDGAELGNERIGRRLRLHPGFHLVVPSPYKSSRRPQAPGDPGRWSTQPTASTSSH